MSPDPLSDDSTFSRQIIQDIRDSADKIGRTIRLMEVCGTHTVALRQHGIHSLLPDNIRLVSGPGCPVCVTPSGYIDNALELASSGKFIVASFGDMLKVPGTDGKSLSSLRGSGNVRVVYSPAELLQIAVEGGKPVVFLAIGFETTAPAIASSLRRALHAGIENLFLYTAFKTVPPALKALLNDDELTLDGFILPGHVSVILGRQGYLFLEEPSGLPSAITGFEPIDMLLGIRAVLAQILTGTRKVENMYPRAVREEGNRKAQDLINEVFTPSDELWRGIGTISQSGLALNELHRNYDAAVEFEIEPIADHDPPGCLCALVIQGKALPPECGLFAAGCTPDHPVGPCMVSSEGTCAAYLKYGE